MDLDANHIEREEILYRYFQKELKPEERAEVEAWVDNSSENQQVFHEAKMMFLDLKGLAYYKNAEVSDANRSWEEFKEEHQVKSIHRLYKPSVFFKYAAGVAIAVSTFLGIYYYQNQVEEIVVASKDEIQEAMLPDESLVSLNRGASIEYSEPFQNNERRVKLKGDAYFEVARVPERPFVVETEGVEVRVLGTKFFVNKTKNGEIDIRVNEGKVLVSYEDKHQIIASGESVAINLENGELSEIEDITGVATFWKMKKLVFRLTSLEDAIAIVNEAYGTSVRLVGSTESCAITVTFEDEELKEVLQIISSTLNYELVEGQGTYVLKGNGCQ